MVEINSPRISKELGISVIYQEFVLAPDLSVAENLFIDHLDNSKGIINWKKLNENASALLCKIGFGNINPKTRVSKLTIAQQQVVEICKALSRESRILILDEPTAVLTFKEKEQLFTLLRELKTQGVSIVFVSHRLEEIFELCDRVTVFKDGQNVDTVNTQETNKNALVQMMIGREMSKYFPARQAVIGEEVLRVENISRGKVVKGVSFNVHAGEVIGFSGLVGAGRTGTMRLIFGADKKDGGSVFLHGKSINIHSEKDAVKHKIGFLPEDRKRQGVILQMPIKINATLSSLKKITTSAGVLQSNKENEIVKGLVNDLTIRLRSIEDNVSTLSGGNQQKVSFSKWIATECDCVILDEPTRGVDVGAKMEIYQIINTMAQRGAAIIVVSSEMEELIGMCDRIYVMSEGRITGELDVKEATEHEIMRMSVGSELR